jgi:2-dehydropantoate 2-reductase
VKTWQVPAAAQSLAYLIPTKARVLTLQNGVEAPYQVAEVLGRDHVLGCVCKIIAALVAPGHIRHVGMDPTITLGELGNRQMSEQSAAITEALRSAGINVHETGNVESALWQKLLFIASMSGVGSVTRSSIGEVRELPETRQMLIEVMNEVREVAAAHGVILESSTVGQTVSFIDSLPPSGTASMQRDITSGRPSELEAIIGVIVKMAAALHVEVPTTRFIYSALLAQEQRNRSIQSPGATASGPSN